MTPARAAERSATTFLRVVYFMEARAVVVGRRAVGWRMAALRDVAVGPVTRAALHPDLEHRVPDLLCLECGWAGGCDDLLHSRDFGACPACCTFWGVVRRSGQPVDTHRHDDMADALAYALCSVDLLREARMRERQHQADVHRAAVVHIADAAGGGSHG